MERYKKFLESMQGKTVMVVGDIMLDLFVYGTASRLSPEGPVPVLAIQKQKYALGGCGNVLSNLCTLGLRPSLLSFIGDDENGRKIKEMIGAYQVRTDTLFCAGDRPTTVKTRFVAQNQQLLRTDFEKTGGLTSEDTMRLLEKARQLVKQAHALILSDYGKGVLTPHAISELILMAKEQNIPVLVDPKGTDYSKYKGADIVTPNRKELSEATGGKPCVSDEHILEACQSLIEKSGIESVVATRSEDGMSVVRGPLSGKGHEYSALHIRSIPREVFDVSGAGDTVIATIAGVLCGGGTLEDAAHLANIAGGLVVGKTGTAPICLQELKDALHEQTPALASLPSTLPLSFVTRAPFLTDWEDAAATITTWQKQGLKVGFTNGCFDILHHGHVSYLAQARLLCDRLVVGLNNDSSVRLLKGPTRPINDETARSNVLCALKPIDMVILFGAKQEGEDNTPCALLGEIKPDIYVKGGDYKLEDLPEAALVKTYGGVAFILGLCEGYSTTKTIDKIGKGIG